MARPTLPTVAQAMCPIYSPTNFGGEIKALRELCENFGAASVVYDTRHATCCIAAQSNDAKHRVMSALRARLGPR